MSTTKTIAIICIFLLICIFFFSCQNPKTTPQSSLSAQSITTTESTEITNSMETTLLTPSTESPKEQETITYDTQNEFIPDDSDTPVTPNSSENIISSNENTTEHIPVDEIGPSEEALLEAGVGTVVLLPTGDYGILMENPDQTINGKRGNEILREYLATMGLDGTIYGCWMNDHYYNFFAENIQEQLSVEDEAFWD